MQTLSSTSLARPSNTDRFRSAPLATDADAVEALTRAAGAFNASEVQIARELVEEALAEGCEKSGYHFLFADGMDANGAARLDGYACFGPIPMAEGRFELYWIAVHPDARRSGVGRELARATEDWVRAGGGTHIFCATSTRPDYWAARAFYEAQGYTQHADIPDYHADGDGMAIFGKRL
jgi:ribosomal protein S18 acetylase RimI-like enzyme